MFTLFKANILLDLHTNFFFFNFPSNLNLYSRLISKLIKKSKHTFDSLTKKKFQLSHKFRPIQISNEKKKKPPKQTTRLAFFHALPLFKKKLYYMVRSRPTITKKQNKSFIHQLMNDNVSNRINTSIFHEEIC